MKHYEIVFLVHPDQSDKTSAMTKRIVSIVKDSGGKIHRSEDWKRRQLAYPIAKVHKAHYLLMNVECTLDAMSQIREYFRFNEGVLRNLILDVGRPITSPSPIKTAAPQEEVEDGNKEKFERKFERAEHSEKQADEGKENYQKLTEEKKQEVTDVRTAEAEAG